jgi:hypothetical protein
VSHRGNATPTVVAVAAVSNRGWAAAHPDGAILMLRSGIAVE